jgi:predicted O-methyltransferase YrrM
MGLIENIHIQNITKILLDIGERVEGNLLCDIIPTNWTYKENEDKIKNLQFLCLNKKKIMEIGINGCHSLIIMLLINPTADYLLFDLGNHGYTRPIVKYVKEAFPETNINVIYGNSIDTIFNYIINNPDEINTYDLIHLDGGHTEDVFSQDYINSKKLLKKDGLVIFDDYDMLKIKNFIDEKISQNEIMEYFDSNITKNLKHFIFNYI